MTKKFQWEVSQIGNKERSLAPLYRWFKCKLKPPKKANEEKEIPTVAKGPSQPGTSTAPEINIDEDDDDDVSVASASSQPQGEKLLTLGQKKKITDKKYKNFCSLKEAQLFYPTTLESMHMTGVDPSHISECLKIKGYKGYYQCKFSASCEYAAQTHEIMASHIRRVHLGHALACRFCPTLAWWQVRYWSEHMDKQHSDQPKFEPLIMPEGEIKAEEINPNHFICEEHFTIPTTQPAVPIHCTERKAEVPEVHHSSRKRSLDDPPVSQEKQVKVQEEDLEEVMEAN